MQLPLAAGARHLRKLARARALSPKTALPPQRASPACRVLPRIGRKARRLSRKVRRQGGASRGGDQRLGRSPRCPPLGPRDGAQGGRGRQSRAAKRGVGPRPDGDLPRPRQQHRSVLRRGFKALQRTHVGQPLVLRHGAAADAQRERARRQLAHRRAQIRLGERERPDALWLLPAANHVGRLPREQAARHPERLRPARAQLVPLRQRPKDGAARPVGAERHPLLVRGPQQLPDAHPTLHQLSQAPEPRLLPRSRPRRSQRMRTLRVGGRTLTSRARLTRAVEI
mmetsp:Transcript_16425/g.53659  ORF Transcript_16425/g.53659 Transcript_16425/m.53659 type:complete len:283 (-) Transcript_16425:93-941(-)